LRIEGDGKAFSGLGEHKTGNLLKTAKDTAGVANQNIQGTLGMQGRERPIPDSNLVNSTPKFE
jgi:hypothetical protein